LPDGKLLHIGNAQGSGLPLTVTDAHNHFRIPNVSEPGLGTHEPAGQSANDSIRFAKASGLPETSPAEQTRRRRVIRFESLLAAGIGSVLLLLPSGCRHEPSLAGTRQHLDFNQDVQPILAARCFSCHGPDPEMRKAGLRLDLAESAMKKRPGHPDAIVPGHPEQSELVKRIESKDPHHLMPQTSEGEAKPMKADEIAVLREWIKEGAAFRPHWAFEAPARPPLPTAMSDGGWAKTPIDSFVLARMEKERLKPSPEADKPTLIRRVTLDLTGLLPTPAEVRAFANDSSPQAYEHVVDGLLARPVYGEQRARYWMDYARYADTYGLHYDNSRDIWPYRDYLIGHSTRTSRSISLPWSRSPAI